jgi:hypothetical protein
MPSTNTDQIGPKCPERQIDDPHMGAKKIYGMSINADKYQPGAEIFQVY